MSKMLTKQKVSVDLDGPLIKLTFGEFEVRLEYETAIQVSQWLRIVGKQAKALAGDKSRHWSAVGVLGDVNNDPAELAKLASLGRSFDVRVG